MVSIKFDFKIVMRKKFLVKLNIKVVAFLILKIQTCFISFYLTAKKALCNVKENLNHMI